MDLVGQVNWDRFKSLIGKDAHDTFNQKPITWRRASLFFDDNGEDNQGQVFTNVELLCLLDYNVFRKWPITTHSETGEIDRQTVVVMMSKDYLRTLGYLNTNDNFDVNIDEDKFIINGIVHKCFGDTEASQVHNTGTLIQLVLEREKIATTHDNN